MLQRCTYRFALIFLLSPIFVDAQSFEKSREIGLSIGFSNFLGDLGGANHDGRALFWDIDPGVTRPAVGIVFTQNLNPRFGLRFNAYYSQLRGDDALTEEPARNYRNLHFKSNIFELSMVFELNILKFDPNGRAGGRFTPYIFGGVGGFYYEPKARFEGEWIQLRPLGTEGQGLPEYPDRKKYATLDVSFPLGAGIKYAINKNWTLAFEVAPRLTLTDYIDDVSTTYADPDFFYVHNTTDQAEIIAAMADPSSGEFPTHTAPGTQRGDEKNNDSYIFGGLFTVKYRLPGYKMTGCPGF